MKSFVVDIYKLSGPSRRTEEGNLPAITKKYQKLFETDSTVYKVKIFNEIGPIQPNDPNDPNLLAELV